MEMPVEKKRTVCDVCMHHCSIEEGKSGICGARKNIEGRIIDVNYGQITSMALDPIEKKPLRMFCPGSKILSVGSFGCNLTCPFCQNYEISRMDESDMEARRISPEMLVETAISMKCKGNIGIAYTYNEPLVGWEYVRDASRIARNRGLKNVLVTNGTAELPVLERLIRSMDAMNIDLKCFSAQYYRELGGDLDTVKAFIERAARSCHVEVTTLIVPGKNDSEEEMDRLSDWLSWINYGIPLHVTRYFPRYKMTEPPTDVETVFRLADVARKNLKYVFEGNC